MNKKEKKEIKFFFYKTAVVLIAIVILINISINIIKENIFIIKENILETFSYENKKKIFLIIKDDLFYFLEKENTFSEEEVKKIKEFIKKFN